MAMTAPTFTLTKTFSLADSDFDAAFVLDLLQNKGFQYSVANGIRKQGGTRSAAKVRAKPKRRRRLRSPLTAERIKEFRKARTDGKSYRRIGAIFGVSEGRAWQIINKGR